MLGDVHPKNSACAAVQPEPPGTGRRKETEATRGEVTGLCYPENQMGTRPERPDSAACRE